MQSVLMKELKLKAQGNPKKVVFPETHDEKIIRAARMVLDEGIAYPILVGERLSIINLGNSIGIDLKGIKIVDNETDPIPDKFVQEFIKINPVLSEDFARDLLTDPLNYGAMMLRMGKSDAMVAGLCHTTGEIIMISNMIIGLQEGINTASSIFLMSIPNYKGSEGNMLVFADGGVCPDPTPEELADIAISTADTVAGMLGWEPRIAMLSFSTKGSACHPRTERVLKALAIVKRRRPDILIDGELQGDAALVEEIAKKKVPGGSPVAGKANILIFPDLDSANIAYKLVQRLANADAYGPFLQGFAKTVSDLSRGSSIDDIIGVTVMAVVRAQSL